MRDVTAPCISNARRLAALNVRLDAALSSGADVHVAYTGGYIASP